MPVTFAYGIQKSLVQTDRRIAPWIFVMLLVSYGYFHQGGGWGQNSRFNQVRAIVENQQLEINDYWVFQVVATDSVHPKIARLVLPQNSDPRQFLPLASTADVSFFNGKIVPNKPPGTVLLAVPAYWLIYQVESFLEIDPDSWWTLTLNAHLSSALSVGLITALGGVVFYLTSKRLLIDSPTWTHVASTLTYGLGTLILPFATLLFDHGLTASFSLFAFYFLLAERHGGFESIRSGLCYFLSGVFCGVIVMLNYAALISVGCLISYGCWISKRKTDFVLYSFLGAALPIALLLWYHFVCFGSPFATAHTNQLAMFHSAHAAVLGMLGVPRFEVIYELLFSYYRGLFYSSPVLLLALISLIQMVWKRQCRPEAYLIGAIFIAYLLMNSAFNHWHAGWTFGPRYLIPALPFLALPLALAFMQLPRIASGLAVFSASLILLITTVDPQVPSETKNPLYDHVLALAQGDRFVWNGINIEGPVSANPMGVFEGWERPDAGINAAHRRWHSFNLGEFFWQGSFWSLTPLLVFLGIGLFGIRQQLEKMEKVPPAMVAKVSSS